MGSPVYGMPTLSFFETTSIFRLDDTVRAVEILQGGPSVVFAGGQMGATANFLLKTGTDTPSGSVGLTYGDENLWRLDGFFGFPICRRLVRQHRRFLAHVRWRARSRSSRRTKAAS